MAMRKHVIAIAGAAALVFAAGGLGMQGAAMAAEPEITVDLGKEGAAISPYLYGQFIEHLGRCIRDGIWAEKLKDRKFLLEPGKSWQITKPEGAVFDVVHDTAGAYAGDHCMALHVRDPKGGACGIRQGGIGLAAGKEYVGYAILAHVGPAAPVAVRLAWGDGADAGQTVTLADVGRAYRKFPLRFKAAATTDAATLSVTLSQPANLWLACLSLMPAENTRGMRTDTLDLIRRLAPPITRWPGGNFVSGYRWKDAIGDRDRRPPRWERAWNDVEDNDFGIDEFMTFCKEVGTEPYIAVNTGLGSVGDAADEVEYANGSARTRWGSERAAGGAFEPYKVVWWGIGNEMYGGWQLGNVPVERYALRHSAFVEAMRGRDPAIKVIAVGNPGGWNDVVLPACATHMDLLSGHHYTERKFRMPLTPEDAGKYEQGFVAYSGAVAGGVRGLVADFRKRLQAGSPEVRQVRLAVDEWGIVRDWNAAPDGPGVGSFEHYYSLGDAIAVARAMHEILRSADVVSMANWAQTVNVIGTIKTSRTAAALDPAGHVLALYRAHFKGSLVPFAAAGDTPVDVVAARDKKSGVLAIGLVNFSPRSDVSVRVRAAGAPKVGAVAGWRISAADLGAVNVPGQPEAVTTTPVAGALGLDKPLTLPAHSITVLEVKCEGQ
jgi:alpha-N-arabinofuranosidase